MARQRAERSAGGKGAAQTFSRDGGAGGAVRLAQPAQVSPNQLSALTDPHGQTVYYKHDELGREVEKALPNGVTTYHKYDSASQVTDIIHLGPSGVLQSLYYVYDAAGRRTRIDREDGTSIYYGYDDADRLTGEDWLDASQNHLYAFTYEYDDAGNRKKKTFNDEVTYYDYNNNLNQLTTEAVLGGATTYYTWTADGEMATKQEAAGWTYYTWDVDESLTKIETPETTLESKYNSRMQRVWRREDGEAEWLVYDAQKLVAEATTGGLERYYLSEGGSVYSPLVSQLGSQHWFLFDALGTTLGLTDGEGGLSDSFLYEAFGTSLGRTGTTETPYQYVGGYGYFQEARVGLEQVWWRWYTHQSGRWSSHDIIPFEKPYAYVNSSPVAGIDPLGMSTAADMIMVCAEDLDAMLGNPYRYPGDCTVDPGHVPMSDTYPGGWGRWENPYQDVVEMCEYLNRGGGAMNPEKSPIPQVRWTYEPNLGARPSRGRPRPERKTGRCCYAPTLSQPTPTCAPQDKQDPVLAYLPPWLRWLYRPEPYGGR